MLIATTWEQTPYYDPTNPNQIVREAMVGTGGDRGYASFYHNQVPNQARLLPLSGALPSLPMGSLKLAGIGLAVMLAAGGVAYFFAKRGK